MVYCLFVSTQALGLKLLRKKDVPDYKVLAIIWHRKNVVMFNSVERNAMQFPSLDVVFFQFSGLNVFTLIQYTIAMLGYADEDKTTVLELTYNYGVTEYSKGNAYAQVFMKSLSEAFF
jgi:hypothetical protein